GTTARHDPAGPLAGRGAGSDPAAFGGRPPLRRRRPPRPTVPCTPSLDLARGVAGRRRRPPQTGRSIARHPRGPVPGRTHRVPPRCHRRPSTTPGGRARGRGKGDRVGGVP